MTDAGGAAQTPPTSPPPLALAVAHDLVTRHRLRLTDARDARLGPLGDAYVLGAAAWTGRRAAFVGFYEPPADAQAAAADLDARCAAAARWAGERLGLQGAESADVLLVALGPVARPPASPALAPGVRLGAVAVDQATGSVTALRPTPSGLPGTRDIRRHLDALRGGRPAPTLAAVDLAERQTVAGGYAQPARRAMTQTPMVTYGLLGAFVLVYILERSLNGHVHDACRLDVIDMGALVNTNAPTCGGTASPSDWWRYVSSGFLHDPSGFFHILGNGIALFYLGTLVEQLYGRLVLLSVFLVSAAGGGLLWVAAHAVGIAGTGVSLGASGGIVGLMGLLVVLGRVQGRDVPSGIVSSIRQYAISYALLSILFGFIIPNVNNEAHIGGFVTGALLGLVIPPAEAVGGRATPRWLAALMALSVLVAAVALGIAGHALAQVASTTSSAPPV